jgi:hypothetical protein
MILFVVLLLLILATCVAAWIGIHALSQTGSAVAIQGTNAVTPATATAWVARS